ncbi:MAG: dienelactone hydrolase family protein, partial [Pseudomonadales bacterium]|nr:dienelactone hydrolase family protein [Pseudomonadales bacterium]
MCDEDTVRDNEAVLGRGTGVSRRQFHRMGAAVAVGALLPRAANAQTVTDSEVSVATPDGLADCYFVHPSSGRHPGVIVWPDVLGLRPAFRLMGKRLAESGYSVLVVNPYYRSERAPILPEGASFADESTRNKIMPLMGSLNAQTHVTDARAFVAYLHAQAAVDTSRKIGTTGYCMGGPITMRTAAALPDRIGAAASFHGGGLVAEGPESPHLLVPKMKASYLFAIAANDDERQPEAKDV